MFDMIFFGGPIFFMILCELFAIIALGQIYSSKRYDRWLIKGLLFVVIIIVVIWLDYIFVSFDNASTALEAPFCFVAVFIYAYTAFKIPLKEALYCTVWAYIITEVTTQIIMPVADTVNSMAKFELHIVDGVFYGAAILIMFTIVKYWLSKELQWNGRYPVGRQKLLLTILVSWAYISLSNYQFIFWLLGYEPETGSNMITIFRFIVGMACLFYLYMQNSIEKRQRVEQELDMIHHLWYCQRDQYKLSQENIDLINRKCHDLKYQIGALRTLKDGVEADKQIREMENAVMIYDSGVKTGNVVLDTVLTEKSLYCEEHHIVLTCMADGTELEFIESVDLYTMFGNALDNAIESVIQQKNKEKRIIQVTVIHEKNLLVIRIANYHEGNIKFANGLPISTKEDKGFHGFGLKSIRYTAEKYGGGIVCQRIDNYFVLQILLAKP